MNEQDENNIITTTNQNQNNEINTSLDQNQETMFYSEENPNVSDKIKNEIKSESDFLIIFINPRSGSQQGKLLFEYAEQYIEKSIPNYKLLSFPVNKIKNTNKEINKIKNKIEQSFHFSKFEKNRNFSTILFNIIDKSDYEKGIFFIKNYFQDFPKNTLKILVAGGDGTVLSVVEELNKKNIPLKKCIFGAMPFGTGNDLSNALGFGNKCHLHGIKNLQRVLYTYLTATKTKIDIWELDVIVDNNKGLIFDVVKDGEKLKTDIEKKEIKKFSKTFVNYCSIGFDARVGFQFEQKRSSSRFCNKIIYCEEAFKRIFCCKKNYGLSQLLESFEEGENNEYYIQNEQNEQSELNDIKNIPLLPDESNDSNNTHRNTIFKTRKGNVQTDKILKGNPVNIICQNIKFYMGGTQNIWEKSDHLAIKVEDASRKQYKEYRKEVLNSFNKQRFDDKKIEFFTYEHGIELGLERVARGLAKKVYQGSGPVFLEFKKMPNATESKALTKVYMNADGEFFHLVYPTQLRIGLSTKICDGQINILKNDMNEL